MRPGWYINGFLAYTLQGLLFWRGYRSGLWKRYPLFYAYLFYTTCWSVIQGIPSVLKHPSYPNVFWSSQLGAGILRFGVAAEVHRHVFPPASKLRRPASAFVVGALLVMALLYWALGASPAPSIVLDALRKIALSVAVWILLVLGLAQYYGIRAGRNVWGMAVGLLIFMGSELVHLAAMDMFPRLRTAWGYVHPITYVCMLMIWTVALWNYGPNPRIVPLHESESRELLSAWGQRWRSIADILRKVAKP